MKPAFHNIYTRSKTRSVKYRSWLQYGYVLNGAWEQLPGGNDSRQRPLATLLIWKLLINSDDRKFEEPV